MAVYFFTGKGEKTAKQRQAYTLFAKIATTGLHPDITFAAKKEK